MIKTLDWSQPIENLEFLKELPNLEVFALGYVKVQQEYPAFVPILELRNLKRIKIGLGTLETKEYAFIQVAKPNVQCGAHGKHMPWSPISDWGEGEFMPLGQFKNGKVIEATISRGLPSFAKLAVIIHELNSEKTKTEVSAHNTV